MFIGIIGGLLTMGLAGFVLGPVMIVLLITSYRIYVSDKKERARACVSPDKDPSGRQ
jgi:predicted PurR-regulated permease PerM